MKIIKRKKDIHIPDLMFRVIDITDMDSFIKIQETFFNLKIYWVGNGNKLLKDKDRMYECIYIDRNRKLCNGSGSKPVFSSDELLNNFNILE